MLAHTHTHTHDHSLTHSLHSLTHSLTSHVLTHSQALKVIEARYASGQRSIGNYVVLKASAAPGGREGTQVLCMLAIKWTVYRYYKLGEGEGGGGGF